MAIRARTRRRHQKRTSVSTSGILTIPELRHAFDFIDSAVAENIKKPVEVLVNRVQEEWKKVFYKNLSKKDAMDYVRHLKKIMTRKRGGYAPVNYTMRPGIENEHAYVQVPKYMAAGLNTFQYPEIAQTQDPIHGQVQYPTAAPVSMGGRRHRKTQKRRKHGGMAALQQAFIRPIPSSVPPTVGQNLESTWAGQSTGASSDVTVPNFKYMMSPKLSN